MQVKKIMAIALGALMAVSLGSCVKKSQPKVSLTKEETTNVSAMTAVAATSNEVVAKGLKRANQNVVADNEKLFQAALKTVDKLRGNIKPEVKEVAVVEGYTKNILIGDCEIHSNTTEQGEEVGIVKLSNMTYYFNSKEVTSTEENETELERVFELFENEKKENRLVKVVYETEEEKKEDGSVEKEVELKYEFNDFEYSVELDDMQENKNLYEFEIESELDGKELETVYFITNNGNAFTIVDKDNKTVARYNRKEDGTFEKDVI